MKHILIWRLNEFPNAVSYNRFIALISRVGLALRASCTVISFVDATAIMVCDNKRIVQHRVFGKTSMSGFYEFKLQLIVNERGSCWGFQN